MCEFLEEAFAFFRLYLPWPCGGGAIIEVLFLENLKPARAVTDGLLVGCQPALLRTLALEGEACHAEEEQKPARRLRNGGRRVGEV